MLVTIGDYNFKTTRLFKIMLRLRLKRTGRKRLASYRIVVMEQATRRDGRPIDELGFYNPC